MASPQIYCDGAYRGQPPVGTAFTGMQPGDFFLYNGGQGYKIARAVDTGRGDGTVMLVSLNNFQPVGLNLSDALDVAIASPADGQVLTYDGASSKWKNKAASGGSPNFLTMPYIGYVYAASPFANSFPTLSSLGDVATTFGTASDPGTDPTATTGPVMVRFSTSSQPNSAGFYGRKLYRIGRNPKMLVEARLTTLTNALVWLAFNTAGAASSVSQYSHPQAFGTNQLCAGFRFFNGQDAFSINGTDTHWQACIFVNGASGAMGGIGLINDTGVAPDTNEHRFAVIFDDANQNVLFYIDGNLVSTVSLAGVTVPDGGKDLQACVSTYQTFGGGPASPSIDFSYAQMQVDW